MSAKLLIFLTAFTVGLSGAIMPGPMLTMVITQTSKHKFKGGLYVIAGHALLETLLVIALLLGLQRWMMLPAVSGIIGLIGGLVMSYLGSVMLRDAWQGRVSLEITNAVPASPIASTYRLGPFGAGVISSLVNPYFILWWSTIGAGYLVLASKQGIIGVSAFFSGHLLADAAWFSMITFAVLKSVQLLKPKHYQLLIGICGIFMFGLGIYFLKGGYHFLL